MDSVDEAGAQRPVDANAVFAEHRDMLFGVAYRLLGSVADAEDVVQDAWLRWSATTATVRYPKAYLARTVTNLALNRRTSAAARRESYVGPWLPEPMVSAPDAADEVERAESVSLAFLVVLESLSPLERAVFVLHEAFGFAYSEVADMLGHSAASVRQVGHRAREHVQARRPRYETSPEDRREVTRSFLAAAFGGDMDTMMALLAPGVTMVSDGGGKKQAALRPIHGADKVARWALGVIRRTDGVTAREVLVNGVPGIAVLVGGELDTVACLDVTDGAVAGIHAIRNPDKLGHIRVLPDAPELL